RLLVGDGRPRLLAAPGDALELELAHQAGDALASDVDVVVVGEIELHPRRAVGLERAVVDRHDQPLQLLIAQLPQTRPAPPPSVEPWRVTPRTLQSREIRCSAFSAPISRYLIVADRSPARRTSLPSSE